MNNTNAAEQQKQAIRAQIDALHESMAVEDPRMQFRGGSQLEEERCQEAYKSWAAMKRQVATLNQQIEEIDNAADADILRGVISNDANDAENVAALVIAFGERLDESILGRSKLAWELRGVIRGWYDIKRTDAEKMAIVRKVLA